MSSPLIKMAARALAQPGDRLGQLALPVARHPRDAHDLARAHLERQVIDRLEPAIADGAEVLHVEHDGAGICGRLLQGEHHLTADHQLRQLALAHALGADAGSRDAALAQHGHPVGDGQHFVELMADEDDRVAAGDHALQRGDELSDLLRRQHRGRLVENQDARTPIEHLQDLDALLLADAELPDLGPGIDLQPILLLQRQDALVEFGHIEDEPRGVQAEDDILRHGLGGNQHEVLMDHAQAGRDRIARGPETDALAFHVDRAGFRLVEAGQHVHQGALAGAILAQQRVDLALAQVEIDMIVGKYAGEAFDDPDHLHCIDRVDHGALL